MKIQFNQADIETAIKLYVVSAYGVNLTNKSFEAIFKAGRKGSGVSVSVTIEDDKSALVDAVVGSMESVNAVAAKTREAELVNELISKVSVPSLEMETEVVQTSQEEGQSHAVTAEDSVETVGSDPFADLPFIIGSEAQQPQEAVAAAVAAAVVEVEQMPEVVISTFQPAEQQRKPVISLFN